MPVPGVRPGRAGIGGPRYGQGREGEAGVYINNNTPGTGQGRASQIGRGYQDDDVLAPDVTDDTDIQDDVTWHLAARFVHISTKQSATWDPVEPAEAGRVGWRLAETGRALTALAAL